MQKVFLVDDSPLVRQRLALMVGGLPQNQVVGHAAGVEEAIRGILAAQPDVVLLDLSLDHGGSGFDVLSAIHAQHPAIAFYVLSNFASEPYRRRAERLGARGFFDKSTDMELVRSALKGLKGETQCQPSSH
jgi:DNA-binding NarL/FixJ family response regulator